MPDLDLLDLLSADHHNLQGVEQAALVKAVLEHMWVEKELLHPAVREYADRGDETVQQLVERDDRLEDGLADLEEAGSDESRAGSGTGGTRLSVRARLSPGGALPAPSEAIPEDVLTELADSVPLAIGGAPTRPRSGRSEGLLGEVAEEVAAATDHLRDFFHRGDRD